MVKELGAKLGHMVRPCFVGSFFPVLLVCTVNKLSNQAAKCSRPLLQTCCHLSGNPVGHVIEDMC